jgi:hypothetical protein
VLHKSTNTMACHVLIHPSIFKRGCEDIPQIVMKDTMFVIAMFNELNSYVCMSSRGGKTIDQLVHVHNYCCPTQPTSQS